MDRFEIKVRDFYFFRLDYFEELCEEEKECAGHLRVTYVMNHKRKFIEELLASVFYMKAKYHV